MYLSLLPTRLLKNVANWRQLYHLNATFSICYSVGKLGGTLIQAREDHILIGPLFIII